MVELEKRGFDIAPFLDAKEPQENLRHGSGPPHRVRIGLGLWWNSCTENNSESGVRHQV
jgi:hypothetical protein